MSQLPARLTHVLREHGVDPETLHAVGKWGVPRPVERLLSPLVPSLVVEIAQNSAGQLRIRREVHGRRWAAQHGINTARVFASDDNGVWLVSEWLPASDRVFDKAYVDSALLAARTIAQAPAPTAGPPPQQWRSPFSQRAARLARGIAHGPPLRLWWATRKAAARLPQTPIAHGDFYHRNVLWRSEEQQVCVIDWEYLSSGPRYGDIMRMWTILPTRANRDYLLENLLTTTPPAHHREIALTGLWLALRLIGENVKAPKAVRNAEDTAHAQAMLTEATKLAHAHDAWPM